MIEREIRDKDNTTWRCVQAFAGSNGEAAKQAQKITGNNGQVEVVCTPSGGAQTVRLTLESDWSDKISDEELVKAISQNQEL